MPTSLWSLCKLSLFVTLLWMFMASLALVEECYGFALKGPPQSCSVYITQYEKKHGIPEGLLQAISKIESGRKDSTGQVVSWPWTINSEGQGHHFPTKEAAITAVRELQAKGVNSIDVGCMQVNLHHHPDAFQNLEDAFDPQKNVAYAANFLKKLKINHASWLNAIAHYHSANPTHHIPYRKKVMHAWNNGLTLDQFVTVMTKNDPRRHTILQGSKKLSLARNSLHTPSRIKRVTCRGPYRSHGPYKGKTLKL